MKILTMLQLLQHCKTLFSPAGNLAAAILNTEDFPMEGQITAHAEQTGGWFLNHGNNL